jgi:hypothetical protein
MKLRNRLLSLLLATSMVVGSVQMTSLAQEDTTKTELSISSVETEDENPDDQNRGG